MFQPLADVCKGTSYEHGWFAGIYINGGTPKWMVYGENPINMDDLQVPVFQDTSIWGYLNLFLEEHGGLEGAHDLPFRVASSGSLCAVAHRWSHQSVWTLLAVVTRLWGFPSMGLSKNGWFGWFISWTIPSRNG